MWTWVTRQSDPDGSETKSIFEKSCSAMAYGGEMLLQSSPTGSGTLPNHVTPALQKGHKLILISDLI